jgi:hypothetical protein
MRKKEDVMTLQRSSERRVIKRCIIQGVLFAFVLLVFQVASGSARADGSTDPCAQTSQAALKACRNAANEAFWLAIGKCDNISDPDEKKGCIQDAQDEAKSDSTLCNKQFYAREEVCAELGGGAYDPDIDPGKFVNDPKKLLGNTYFPLIPGTTLTYESDVEKIVVKVTKETKEILGITCRVVRDTVTDKVTGELVEDTIDWYGLDKYGNAWYCGESTQQFDQGERIGIEGSWKAGRDGAKPGIIMKAYPLKGAKVYRQEFLLGEAEDLSSVDSLGNTVKVGGRTFYNCLHTQDFTPLEPGDEELFVIEDKYYAPGVGLVLTIGADGTREELVNINH